MKRVVIDKDIQHGQPTIEGTRIPIAVILCALADGMSVDEVKQEYDVSDEDIQAALRYAAEIASDDKIIPLN